MGGQWPRAAGLVLGVALDAVAGDPRRFHPVAGFGRAARRFEDRWWADDARRGALQVVVCVVPVVVVGSVVQRWLARRPVAELVSTAVATWVVVGGRSLAGEAAHLHDRLVAGDLPAARTTLPHLCGRDPSHLDEKGLARATVESVAENTSDAVVAPLLWGAVAGVPGLLGYRAVNTLDAMVGHRSVRYLRFGWAAARLDDLANVVPSRLTALTVAAAAPLVGGRPDEAMRAWRRDAWRHPSPNAGPVEAATAGALRVTLGGANRYGDVVEERGRLGDGPPPEAADIPRAVRLCRAAAVAALAVSCAVALGRRRKRP